MNLYYSLALSFGTGCVGEVGGCEPVSLGIGEPTLKYHPSCTGILIPKGETLLGG